MTQKENQSVCSNAEAVKTNNHLYSFETVFQMPYVKESIESILVQNIRQYPLLKGFKDDLRQEILIHLSNQLDSFEPEKSGINTFCRMVISSGMRAARRKYFSRTNHTLAFALDIEDFECHDDDSTALNEEDIRAYSARLKCDVEIALTKSDVQEVLRNCPPHLRAVAQNLLAGKSIRSLAVAYGMNPMKFIRHYMRPLREIFAEKFFKKISKKVLHS